MYCTLCSSASSGRTARAMAAGSPAGSSPSQIRAVVKQILLRAYPGIMPSPPVNCRPAAKLPAGWGVGSLANPVALYRRRPAFCLNLYRLVPDLVALTPEVKHSRGQSCTAKQFQRFARREAVAAAKKIQYAFGLCHFIFLLNARHETYRISAHCAEAPGQPALHPYADPRDARPTHETPRQHSLPAPSIRPRLPGAQPGRSP